jgi:hypothetical protein
LAADGWRKIKKKSSIAFAKLSQPLKLYANAVSGAKPAFTHKALRLAAFFSGHRAWDQGLFKAYSCNYSQDNNDI